MKNLIKTENTSLLLSNDFQIFTKFSRYLKVLRQKGEMKYKENCFKVTFSQNRYLISIQGVSLYEIRGKKIYLKLNGVKMQACE